MNSKEVSQISSRLLSFNAKSEVGPIPENANYAFVGPMPNGKGLVLSPEEKKALVARDKKSKAVLKKWLTGEDLNQTPDQKATRWIIDFQNWSYEEASKYAEPMKIVKETVKPHRTANRVKKERDLWWIFKREQMDLRERLAKLDKFICVSRVSKFPIFVFVDDKDTLPADSTVAISFDDYGHLGVLQSKFHVEWYYYQCSTLKSDLRYTSSTVFDTFPFPEKIDESVAPIMKKIERYRETACQNAKIGLTDVYNQMSEGGHQLLRKLHDDLNKAVAKSYGVSASKVDSKKEIVDFLTALNTQMVSGKTDNIKDKALKKAKAALEKAEKKGVRKRG